jgi:hypothetical protein
VIRLAAMLLVAIAATLAGAGYGIQRLREFNLHELWEAPAAPRARTVQLELPAPAGREPTSEPAATMADAVAPSAEALASPEELESAEKLGASDEPRSSADAAASAKPTARARGGDSAALVRRMISLYERNRALE